MRRLLPALIVAFLVAEVAGAAETLLPQNRNAYLVAEPIEVAVVGLEKGAKATLELVPDATGLVPVRFDVTGDGSTVTHTLPAFSLAPARYTVLLDGQKQPTALTVSRGLHRSTMYVSQTIAQNRLGKSGANFGVSNAFNFGLFDPDGQASLNLRRRSGGLEAQEGLVRDDYPSLIYMYWTGYVLHKPWGEQKSWAAPDMTANMRLFNFHVAQRLRRYGRNILSVGTLDEPGLAWGTTPAGGMATGFPNWDEEAWYEGRGWKFTIDPAARPDDDWMKYMGIRCAILGEQNGQAKKDLKTVWPEVVFSTDLYALHAIMDGTDCLSQRVNDIPSTHVFLDWGTGKLGVIGGLYLEKAHNPTAKIAHAMNGQLFGKRVPQPQMRYAYHLMLNGMLAAGLHSNWWLNFGGMSDEDLTAVNEPAARLGPLFARMAPSDHDTALLWSFTEIAMRCKDVTAKEATKKTGEPIKLLVADYPETSMGEGETVVNAYNIGQNYKNEVLSMHQGLSRAGYPAHIVDERLLPGGALKRYKTLVIVGQTFELPAEVKAAIDDFVRAGGKVVVDRKTRADIPGALVTEADVRDAAFRWSIPYNLKPDQAGSVKKASYYQTNHFMDRLARKAVAPLRATMAKTASQPVFTADTTWLAGERHVAGEGELHLVLNGHEKLPEIPDDEAYLIYNYAPFETSLTLNRIQKDSVVYRISGLDWSKVEEVRNPTAPQPVRLEPGEMNLYLVAPRKPKGLALDARCEGGTIDVSAELVGLKMPWPITVTVKDPAGKELVRIYRALDAEGRYQESLPLGTNAAPGTYTVEATSPVADLRAADRVDHKPTPTMTSPQDAAARVFDEPAIRDFLSCRPTLVIAVGSKHGMAAEKLAAELKARGLIVSVKPEKEVWSKALYPRVWDPYLSVYRPTEADRGLAGREIKRQLTIETLAYGVDTVKAMDGQEVKGNWQEPGTLVTVVGRGWIDTSGPEKFYEPGCKVYVNEKKRRDVVNGEPARIKSSKEVRQKWARPWERLTTHVGGFNLVPQLPEAYAADEHLILLGDSKTSTLVRALQASELLPQVVDEKYPGPGKALVSFAWSPFAVEKNVLLIGATDEAGVQAGVDRLLSLVSRPKGGSQ